MVPLAFGLMLGATRSAKLAERFGTTRVVAGGLLGLGAMLATTLLWTSDMPYWPIGLWFFGVALSMGCIMGPATALGHGRGAQGEGRRRVGDERRHPPGRRLAGDRHHRLAGRVVLRLAHRRRRLRAAVGRAGRGQGLDRRRRRRGRQLPADQGASLAHSAASAFTDALGLGLCAAAVAAFAAAVIVIRRLPARAADEHPRSVTVEVAVQAGGAA